MATAASALIFLAVVVLSGCSAGGNNAAVVSGTVTYKSKPLPAGTITFHGADGKIGSGKLGTDGRYAVSNAPLGPVKISILTPPATSKDPAAVAGSTSVVLPPHYADPDKSLLTFKVEPGSQVHHIDLSK
jgi:hypothetical protein